MTECWPHAQQRVRAVPAAERSREMATLAVRFEALAGELNELLRKSDWNNRHEAKGAEQDSWLRALYLLAGAPDATHALPAPLRVGEPSPLAEVARSAGRLWRRVRPPKPATLDMAGVKLEDALRLPGCSVCRLAEEGARRWLFTLMWEGVMDPEIRGRFRAANGFCPPHWWSAADVERREMHGITGTAILAEDILDALVAQLRFGLLPELATMGCLACQAHLRSEEGALAGIARHLTRPTFRAMYGRSSGCCPSHRQALISRLDDPALLPGS